MIVPGIQGGLAAGGLTAARWTFAAGTSLAAARAADPNAINCTTVDASPTIAVPPAMLFVGYAATFHADFTDIGGDISWTVNITSDGGVAVQDDIASAPATTHGAGTFDPVGANLVTYSPGRSPGVVFLTGWATIVAYFAPRITTTLHP